MEDGHKLFLLKMPKAIHHKLKILSAKKGETMNDLLVDAIGQAIKSSKTAQKKDPE